MSPASNLTVSPNFSNVVAGLESNVASRGRRGGQRGRGAGRAAVGVQRGNEDIVLSDRGNGQAGRRGRGGRGSHGKGRRGGRNSTITPTSNLTSDTVTLNDFEEALQTEALQTETLQTETLQTAELEVSSQEKMLEERIEELQRKCLLFFLDT